MFRYHTSNNYSQQLQYPAEYLGASLQGYPETGPTQQHGSPVAWSGSSGIENAPTVTSTVANSHNSTPLPEHWVYNHGNQQPHFGSPTGHLGGSGMPGYGTHEGYMAAHHGPDSVAQALYTPYKTAPYDCWVRTPTYRYNPQTGKTRTKDKYRVVYTDHQRQKLEDEFRFNRYITIRRKAEIAMALGLSDRQVKIWFQNRRAKERKMQKKIQLAGSQQEKPKATSATNQQTRDPGLLKQESNKAVVKHEALQTAPSIKHDTESTASNSTRPHNGEVSEGAIHDEKYARSMHLKQELVNEEGMRGSTDLQRVEVAPNHLVPGHFTGSREPLMYSMA